VTALHSSGPQDGRFTRPDMQEEDLFLDAPDFREFLKRGQIDEAHRRFRSLVIDFYRRFGRRLPWRENPTPYRVLVSEIMLQQTQVDRVVEKFEPFVTVFPDIASLAGAALQEILVHWQGLGYNRRALSLKRLAGEIVRRHGGCVPDDEAALRTLPGIGPYTAAAIVAFAFDRPAVVIDTNVRAVFIHFFFEGRHGVADAELRPLVAATMDRDKPREWYAALMDYGAMLKKRCDNPARRSKHHVRQGPFEDTDRQLRGVLLRELLAGPGISERELLRRTPAPAGRVRNLLVTLEKEGFVRRAEGGRLFIA
jgi:A/G-specific adenine glycosylase